MRTEEGPTVQGQGLRKTKPWTTETKKVAAHMGKDIRPATGRDDYRHRKTF